MKEKGRVIILSSQIKKWKEIIRTNHKTVISIGIVVLFLSGGSMLMSKGHDAVANSRERKASILTAEQINLAFQGVSGRITKVLVQEEQRVKKGDVLMMIDPTDTELQIEKLKANIAQIDAQIRQRDDTIRIGYQKVDTTEQKTYIDIQKQKLALQGAVVSYDDAKRTYERMKSLHEMGAISKSTYDSALATFDLAKSTVAQQEQVLNRMLEGTTSIQKQTALASVEVRDLSLPEIDQSRQELANNKIGVEQLERQKDNSLLQLKELEVQRERLTLRAPEDGKIIKVVPKAGENTSLNAPVVLLETDDYYYDIYVAEDHVAKLKVGDEICGHVFSLHQEVSGCIRFITVAPEFASMRMSREKGQADLASFQVRIYVVRQDSLLPGMTVEVNTDEFTAR